VERAEAEAIYDQGREVVVAVLLRMDEQIGRLEARVARQDERIARLERRLNRGSRNSSAPPSSDPPSKAAKRGKGSAGRGRGGQPGHEGRGRDLLPACAVDEVIEHWPSRCDCGHVFCEQEHDAVGEPVRHQIEELPELTVRVIEHRAQRVCCPRCGSRSRAQLPRGLTASSFGPRLRAALLALSVRNRISRRDVVELGEELFGARLSTGSVDAILTRASEALEEPYEDLLGRVRDARAVNADETGWRTAGERRALWGLFTSRHAFFQVARDRHEDHAKSLLGDTRAVITSDRWWAYRNVPLPRRQPCWSHLQRDFASHAEGLAAEKDFGEHGLELAGKVFWSWEVFQQTHDRRELKRAITQLQRTYKPIIAGYATQTSTQQALPRHGEEPPEGLALALDVCQARRRATDEQPRRARTPRRRHSPQALPRHPVLHRRARIERLLSAHTTRRLQHRSLFDYLTELIAAHARGEPPPLLA